MNNPTSRVPTVSLFGSNLSTNTHLRTEHDKNVKADRDAPMMRSPMMSTAAAEVGLVIQGMALPWKQMTATSLDSKPFISSRLFYWKLQMQNFIFPMAHVHEHPTSQPSEMATEPLSSEATKNSNSKKILYKRDQLIWNNLKCFVVFSSQSKQKKSWCLLRSNKGGLWSSFTAKPWQISHIAF